MKVRRPRFSMLAGAAITMGAVAAFALPAGAAVSLQSESPPVSAVTLGDEATIDANGAVVFAPTTVVCLPGSYAYLQVTVTQAVRNRIASGESLSRAVTCTGRPQEISMSVTPTQRPFVRGSAFGRASLQFCGPVCGHVQDEHTIELVRR